MHFPEAFPPHFACALNAMGLKPNLTLCVVIASCLSAVALGLSLPACNSICQKKGNTVCRPVGTGANDFHCLPKSSIACARNIYYCQKTQKCLLTSYKGHNFKICAPTSWVGKVADYVKPELLIKQGYLPAEQPKRRHDPKKLHTLAKPAPRRAQIQPVYQLLPPTPQETATTPAPSVHGYTQPQPDELLPTLASKTEEIAIAPAIPAREPERHPGSSCGRLRCFHYEKCAYFYTTRNGNPRKAYVCLRATAHHVNRRSCARNKPCKGEKKCRAVKFAGEGKKSYNLCIGSGKKKCRVHPKKQKRCKRHPVTKCGKIKCHSGKKCAYYFKKTEAGAEETFVCLKDKGTSFTELKCSPKSPCKDGRKCYKTKFVGKPKTTYNLCLGGSHPTTGSKCGKCPAHHKCRSIVVHNSIQHKCLPIQCKPCYGKVYCKEGTQCGYAWKQPGWVKRCIPQTTCGPNKTPCKRGHICVRDKCRVPAEPCGADGTCQIGTKCRFTHLKGLGTEQCLPEEIKKCPGLEYYCPRGLLCATDTDGKGSCKKLCGSTACSRDSVCTRTIEGELKCVPTSSTLPTEKPEPAGKCDGKCNKGEEVCASVFSVEDGIISSEKQCVEKGETFCGKLAVCGKGTECRPKTPVGAPPNVIEQFLTLAARTCVKKETGGYVPPEGKCEQDCRAQSKICAKVFSVKEGEIVSHSDCVETSEELCGTDAAVCRDGTQCLPTPPSGATAVATGTNSNGAAEVDPAGTNADSSGGNADALKPFVEGTERTCRKATLTVQSETNDATCPCAKPRCYLDPACNTGACASDHQYVCLSDVVPILRHIDWDGPVQTTACVKKPGTRKLFYLEKNDPGAAIATSVCLGKDVPIAIPKTVPDETQNTEEEDTCVCNQEPNQQPGFCYSWNNPQNSAVDNSCTRRQCEKSWKCSATQVLVNGKLANGEAPTICRKKIVTQKIYPVGTVFGSRCIGRIVNSFIWTKIELEQ